jgi:hypothetical protein
VVLLDSIKYVTYSCVLPSAGPLLHLVTTWGWKAVGIILNFTQLQLPVL